MLRLWPQSLFAQLTLTLLLVLTLAQLMSAAILFYERGQSLNEVLGLQSVERVSSIVRLFNKLTPSTRKQAISAFSTSNLRISLDIDPLPESSQSADRMHKALHNLFKNITDQTRQVRVQILAKQDSALSTYYESIKNELSIHHSHMDRKNGSSDMMHGSSGMQQMMRDMMGRQTIIEHPFLIQIELDDGIWISIVHQLPEGFINLPYRILASLFMLIVIVSLLSLFVVHRITKPIDTLAVAADELGRDIQRPPLDEKGPHEVKRAAHAFNAMQSRLKQYIKNRSQLLAAISHDLKTPITRLRLRTELLKDTEIGKKFLDDLDDMQTMVDETLNYMRGEDNSEAIQKIDITALIESLALDLHDAGHKINFTRGNQILFHGRPLALKRCLTNLLENAIYYGDSATVYVEELEKYLLIHIVDMGPGIPEEKLEQVFKPFFRLESSRNRPTGRVGLGLGIAREIARDNGGDIFLRNRQEGGLEAVLELPYITHDEY